ncbi:MAG TPA: beta-ketoacyl-[acyl-carrier-protein] synthase family protein [candidate division Zixibacteria bacterium]|nr:beta-ketoacyl-[acyl-carrier-protein] synthase family protein [candidate division Zixibacteria bacterium]
MNPARERGRRVAVTGLGVVSPCGIGADAYWGALRSGVSGVDAITSFDADGLCCTIAAEVRNFRAANHVPEKDRGRVGRAALLALAAAKEALGQAGIRPEELTLEEKRSWGVVLGSGGGAPDFIEEQYRLYFSNRLRQVSAYNVSSATIGTLSSEISMRFDLRGPSHVISTGCTSSTDALGYAFNLIRFGLADHLLSGGVDAPVTRSLMQGFCIMRVVATGYNDQPARASRPFDRRRNGFVLGEGAWIMVLEERERAVARGATIYAEILGYGSTCDAYHRVRLHPDGDEPARAMALAIEDAGVAKDEIGYVALHGTSTVLNDATETRAIKRCFGRRSYEVPMSSVKSMIGHPQGASGAAGAAAAILAMNHGVLPPTINLEDPDPECDLDYIPNRARPKAAELSLCNCIGFGSKNSALVIARGASGG